MSETVRELEDRARELRKIALEMAYAAGSEGAHIGPAFSIMDIMAVLFFDTMNYKPSDPMWEDRDRCILSKGHGCLGLYAPLVMSGYISREEGMRFNQPRTKIAGHPSGKGVPGIEHPSGSLGHGLSVGCGIAKAAKIDGRPYDTYVVVGDGESNEGSIWEAAMFAGHHRLDNLTVVVDVNGLQYGGRTCDLMNLQPSAQKWAEFGWHVVEVAGNDVAELKRALSKDNKVHGKPTCVIAHTVKGCGVSFIADDNDWHHNVLTKEIFDRAMGELS